MLKTLLSLLFALPLVVGAQNLVPNYSFEDTSNCPIISVLESAIPWFQPTAGTSDHFHECVIGSVSVPNNIIGYQYARTGVAYAGIMNAALMSNNREYIEAPLNSPLAAGKEYCIEFYTSLANGSGFATDIIGVHLSVDSLLTDSLGNIPVEPHINSTLGIFLTDTANWMLIGGVYIAQGGEKYITIGNFYHYDSVGIDTVNLGGANVAYHYVDDVYVREMDSIPSSIFAGNVKIICTGESVLLGTTSQPGYAYHWQGPGLWDTTSAEISVSPQQTTDYVLTVTDTMPKPYTCQPTKTDTVTVMIALCEDTLKYNAWLPNVFSPNNDNNNDVLYVRGNNITGMELAIYDRWGEKVFESKDIGYGWSGSYNGKQVNPGVFVYMGKVVFTDGTEKELKGNVTLVR